MIELAKQMENLADLLQDPQDIIGLIKTFKIFFIYEDFSVVEIVSQITTGF